MERSYNLRDFSQARRSFSNALFNSCINEFDQTFRINDIHDKPKLFTTERMHKIVTNKEFFNRFKVDTASNIFRPLQLHAQLQKNLSICGFGSMYFLFGKKGCGKTTLIKHYISMHLHKSKYVSVYLDLHGIDQDINGISKLLKAKIRYFMYNDATLSEYFSRPEKAKEVMEEFKVFSDEQIIREVYTDPDCRYLFQLINHLVKNRNKKFFIFLDNSDELSVETVAEVIRCSYGLLPMVSVKIIHALRDYWGSRKLNLGGQYQVVSTYLTPPDLRDLVEKRINNLNFAGSSDTFEITYFSWVDSKRVTTTKKVSFAKINELISKFVIEAFSNPEISSSFYEMSNYNVREVLDNVYNFFHSCNLPIAPIFQRIILGESKGRELELDDFIRSIMTVHSLCYDFIDSKVYNIFDFGYSDYNGNYRNTLGFIRLLQRCSIDDLVDFSSVVKDFIKVGYDKKSIEDGTMYLINNGLLESPDGATLELIVRISISSKGNFYLNSMLFSFEYLSYVQDRVLMPNHYQVQINSRFGEPHGLAGGGSFKERSRAVRNFTSFLLEEEAAESKEYSDANYDDTLRRIRGNNQLNLQSLSNLMDRRIKEISDKLRWTSNEPGIVAVNVVNSVDENSVDHGHPEGYMFPS